jgi:hypothetical protein
MPDTSSSESQADAAADEPSLEAWLTGLLDQVGVPLEKDGEPLTVRQRHALLMGRYAEHIAHRDVALHNAAQSQRSLLATVRKAARQLKRGEIAKATVRLTQVVTVDTATKALRK